MGKSVFIDIKDKSVRPLLDSLEKNGMIQIKSQYQVRKKFFQTLDKISESAMGKFTEEEIEEAVENVRQKNYEKKSKNRH